MSALGHLLTSAGGLRTSALPPKADILNVEIDVCSVPKADIDRESEEAPSSGDTVPCIIGFDTWIIHNPLMVFNEFGRNTIW